MVIGIPASQADTVNSYPKSISIVDQRTPVESKKHTLSLWIGSCDYFVTRLDDAGMEKSRIDQLRDDLSRSLHKPLIDMLYVKHYTLYVNEGMQMTNAAFVAGTASVGGIAIGGRVGIAKCSKERMTGGWFDSSEVSNMRPPLVGELEVTYLGKEFKVRKVLSPEQRFNYNSNNIKYGNIKIDLFKAINEDLAAQISAAEG